MDIRQIKPFRTGIYSIRIQYMPELAMIYMRSVSLRQWHFRLEDAVTVATRHSSNAEPRIFDQKAL